MLALEAADEAARLMALSAPMGAWTRDAYSAVAEVYLTHWEAGHHAAARPARKACAALRAYARVFPIAEAPAELYAGWLAWQARRPVRAMKAWQRGLAAAERLEMPYDQARLHFEIGRHLLVGDPARIEHLGRARDLLEQIGATYDLGRVTEALSRTMGDGAG